MNNITVIGAGTMGNGIAHVFAQKGHSVILVDRSDEALERALSKTIKYMSFPSVFDWYAFPVTGKFNVDNNPPKLDPHPEI